MSDPIRIVFVGATGMVGRAVVQRAADQPGIHLVALARRPLPPPLDTRVSQIVADPPEWPSVIRNECPDVLVVALGTTWRAAGRDESAFRAVDQDLVLASAKAARDGGAKRCVAVSSVGANAGARSFYLRVKGEVEHALAGLGFDRLDILRPGLLRGARAERRATERAMMLASPWIDRLLHGPVRRYRSIPAEEVAEAILGLAQQNSSGRFIHEHDAIRRAAR